MLRAKKPKKVVENSDLLKSENYSHFRKVFSERILIFSLEGLLLITSKETRLYIIMVGQKFIQGETSFVGLMCVDYEGS